MIAPLRKLAVFGVKAEVLQITFVLGAVCGMIGMAIAMAAMMLIVFASAKALVLAAWL
jgi:hypothetical protein